MADLSELQAAEATKIVGSTSTGVETYPTKVSPNNELGTADVLDNGGASATLALTTVPLQGKIGATPRANRKYVIMEGLTTNVKWGFSSTSQPFDLFKSQLIMVPIGPNTEIWFAVTIGTGSVAFAEVS